MAKILQRIKENGKHDEYHNSKSKHKIKWQHLHKTNGLTLNYPTNVENKSHIVMKQQMNAHYSMKNVYLKLNIAIMGNV